MTAEQSPHRYTYPASAEPTYATVGAPQTDPTVTRIAEHLGLDLEQITNLRAEWAAGDRRVIVTWDGAARIDFATFRDLVAGGDQE